MSKIISLYEYELDNWNAEESISNTVPAFTVFDTESINTGIVDIEGNPIMKSPTKIGFIK